MLVASIAFNSPRFSSLWWVKAPGLKSWQIPRGSTFVSSYHSFLKTIVQNRRVSSVTCSTTETSTLETPFILRRNYSEVIFLFNYCNTQNENYVRAFLIIIIWTQMVTLTLRWSSTDSCVPSLRESGSCTPCSSTTTDSWSRFLSPERFGLYWCLPFKKTLT